MLGPRVGCGMPGPREGRGVPGPCGAGRKPPPVADSGVPAVGTGTQTTVGTKGAAAPGAAAGAGADQAATLRARTPGLPTRWGRIGW